MRLKYGIEGETATKPTCAVEGDTPGWTVGAVLHQLVIPQTLVEGVALELGSEKLVWSVLKPKPQM